jgi:hypothetical protein
MPIVIVNGGEKRNDKKVSNVFSSSSSSSILVGKKSTAVIKDDGYNVEERMMDVRKALELKVFRVNRETGMPSYEYSIQKNDLFCIHDITPFFKKYMIHAHIYIYVSFILYKNFFTLRVFIIHDLLSHIHISCLIVMNLIFGLNLLYISSVFTPNQFFFSKTDFRFSKIKTSISLEGDKLFLDYFSLEFIDSSIVCID